MLAQRIERMAQNRKTLSGLIEENRRLRAQVAQLEDRLDHIAEHGTAAKALQQSGALHREVMGVVSDAVLIADDGGRLSYVSPNAHFIFGHAAADILKHGRIGFLLPGDLFDPDVLQHHGEISNIECLIRDALGRARNLLITVRRMDGQVPAILYVCRDVTERMKIELDYELLSLTLERRVEDRTRELRDSRERYRRLVEGLRDEYLFYASDADGTVTYVSPSVHTILGYTPQQVIGHNWREFVDPNDPGTKELEKLEQMRFAGIPTPVFCASILHSNGETRLLEFRDAPLQDADGRVIANEGIGKDVTARHQAEESLRHAREELEQRVQERTAELRKMYERLVDSEQRYRSVVEDHFEFIIRWHGEGVRTFVNESYCRHCGSTREELIGSSFLTAMVEEDKESLREKLAGTSPDNPVVSLDHRIVVPEGRTVWEHWTHRALFNQHGELIEFQSVGCDVTERRKRESQAQELATARAQLRALSDREREVMKLVVAGDANKNIAKKLNLSVKTIEKHRSSLMKKLHARSVPDLVRLSMLVDEAAVV